MSKHAQSTNRIIGWAFGLSAVWVMAVISLTLLWYAQPVTATFHPNKMGLNELGDFCAGVASPLALLWLVVTVWLQRQNLVEAAQQFNESQTNQFKLALFDKRIQVKEQFQEAVRQLAAGSEDNNRKGITILANAANASEYLFGDSIRTALQEVLDKARRAKLHDLEYDRLQKKSPLNGEEKDKLAKAIDGRYEIAMWMIETLTPEYLNEMFRPYLQMPEP